MPACSLGRASTKDGLPVYVLLCPQLYDRPGNPYGDEAGPRLAGQRRALRPVCLGRGRAGRRHVWTRIGQRTWFTPMTGRPRWRRPISPGTAQDPLDPDHPQPRLSGPVSRGIAAPDRRAGELLPHRRPRILRQVVLPQGRPRLRFAPDHRQRDLCQGDHDAGTRLRARRPAAPALRRRATDRHPERHRRKLGSRASARNWPSRSAPATGRASRPMPITSASSSAWRCRAVRSSAWSRASCIRRASTSCCRPPTRSSRPAGRSSSPAAASPRSSRRWSMRIAAGPTRSASSIGFNDGQARRIFAGSDFTLMPSRFEPCGLSQMYAQRFGSLPIGHQTGGLAETIEDGETGFLFSQPSAESFLGGVRRAFDAFTTKDRLDTRCAAARWRGRSAGIFRPRSTARSIARRWVRMWGRDPP